MIIISADIRSYQTPVGQQRNENDQTFQHWIMPQYHSLRQLPWQAHETIY